MRRGSFRLLVLLVLCSLSPMALPLPGQADTLPASRPLLNARTLEAIERGTAFLASIQRADGSWPSDVGKKVNERYVPFPRRESVPHVGVTSLAVLALLAGGHLPGRGRYGESMERGIDFLLDNVQSSGVISVHGSRMYSHALATLALAEVYGVTRSDRVRAKLRDAVDLTIKSQNETGGWRYVPFTSDSDMSVTVCQVVALRAARNVGIKVPRVTIDRALRYVISSAQPNGAFSYQPIERHFNRDSFSLCAAGLTTLFQAGIYDDAALKARAESFGIKPDQVPSLRDSVAYLYEQYDDVIRRRSGAHHYFFYYGNYYAAQAMYQIGGTHPELWNDWYTMVRDDLLRLKDEHLDPKTGQRWVYWRSNVDTTHAYGTASALLILQFPLDHLPIHQR